MKIIKATRQDSKEISKLMLLDLKNPNPNFPYEMINRFREHAKEENILKEFENPKLIAFVAINKKDFLGFIVGYEEYSNTDAVIGYIDYITAKNDKTKKALLDRFIKECKAKNINQVIKDSFEFMSSNNFFKSNGFKLIKKEKLIENLEVLWYKLVLN